MAPGVGDGLRPRVEAVVLLHRLVVRVAAAAEEAGSQLAVRRGDHGPVPAQQARRVAPHRPASKRFSTKLSAESAK